MAIVILHHLRPKAIAQQIGPVFRISGWVKRDLRGYALFIPCQLLKNEGERSGRIYCEIGERKTPGVRESVKHFDARQVETAHETACPNAGLSVETRPPHEIGVVVTDGVAGQKVPCLIHLHPLAAIIKRMEFGTRFVGVPKFVEAHNRAYPKGRSACTKTNSAAFNDRVAVKLISVWVRLR